MEPFISPPPVMDTKSMDTIFLVALLGIVIIIFSVLFTANLIHLYLVSPPL